MCEDDVVPANGASGVSIGIARGFIIRGTFIIPMVVEKGVDGVSFDRKSTDNGNLKISPRGWAPRPGLIHGTVVE